MQFLTQIKKIAAYLFDHRGLILLRITNNLINIYYLHVNRLFEYELDMIFLRIETAFNKGISHLIFHHNLVLVLSLY